MQYQKKDSVDVLPLSTRSINSLKRNGVMTVEQFLQFSEEEFSAIKSIGTKSINEFASLKKRLYVVEDLLQNNNIPALEGVDNSLVIEIDPKQRNEGLTKEATINVLPLTWNTHNSLEKSGLNTIADVMAFPSDQFQKLPGLESPGDSEIIHWKENLIEGEDGFIKLKKENIGEGILDYEAWKVLQSFFGKEWIPQDVYAEVLTLSRSDPDLKDAKLVNAIFGLPQLMPPLKKKLLQILKKSDSPMTLASIMDYLPRLLKPVPYVIQALKELEEDGAICQSNEGYRTKQLTVMEFAKQIPNKAHRDLFLLRLQGYTLEAAGATKNLTRERVRQIIVNLLKKKPALVQDKYLYLYETYNISQEEFQNVFHEPESTFYYLDMLSGKRKNRNLVEVLDDKFVPTEIKRTCEQIIYKDYITVNGTHLHKDRITFLRYVLSHSGNELTSYRDFKVNYDKLLKDLGLSEDEKLVIGSKNFINYIRESNLALAHTCSSYRYYNIAERDYGQLLEELPLKQFENVEMSTLKFFRDYPELMQQYDIRDEYELHNLLKKIMPADFEPHVTFHRMPTIEIGKADQEHQLMDILLEYGDITVQDLADKYEEIYGVAGPTAIADKFKSIAKYYDHGKYSVHFLTITDEQRKVISKELTGDIYLIEAVRSIFKEHYPNLSGDHINAYTLRSLGFKPYSTYAIRDTYSTALEYFDHILLDEDMIDLQQLDPYVTQVIAFSSELSILKNEMQIIEISPKHYINIRLLEKMGYEKEDLIDFCRKASEFLEPGSFFTVQSLRKQGFTHYIDNIGFSDWFYASLLAAQKDLFSFQRISNSKLFFCGNILVTISSFLEYLLKDRQSIEINDLMALLQDEFDLPIPRYKLVNAAKDSDLYYDPIDEKIYINYNAFLKNSGL